MEEHNINFKSSTGSKLFGTLYLPENSTEKVLIVCPGFGGNASYEQGFGIYAADRGYAVLVFDFFSHGFSPGSSKNLSITEEREDLKAAIKFVSNKFSNIGLVGHSLGGLIACMEANQSKAVVLWSPAIQIKEIWSQLFKMKEMKKISKNPIKTIKERGFVNLPHVGRDTTGEPFVMGSKIWKQIVKLNWKDVVEEIDVPIKIIQAEKDGEPFISFNKKAFHYIKSNKEFESISADHIFRGKRIILYKSTLDWFDKFL